MYNEYEQTAAAMLSESAFPYSESDVALLARDILCVQGESSRTDALAISHAARTLRHRIGGIGNLESYMRCLRAADLALGRLMRDQESNIC